MHDGSEATGADAVAFYDKGGIPNPNLSKEIKPLNLSDQEKRDLVAFLESLTGTVNNATPPDTGESAEVIRRAHSINIALPDLVSNVVAMSRAFWRRSPSPS